MGFRAWGDPQELIPDTKPKGPSAQYLGTWDLGTTIYSTGFLGRIGLLGTWTLRERVSWFNDHLRRA